MSPRRSSARRSWHHLFPVSDNVEPSITPTALPRIPPGGKKPSNSTSHPHSNKSMADVAAGEEMEKEMEEKSSFSTNGGVQDEDEDEDEEEDEDEAEEEKEDEEEEEESLSGSSPGMRSVAVQEKKKQTGRKVRARVWSAQDEVRILECLDTYVQSHRSPPGRSKLCQVLSGHILDKKYFTITQIYEKVRSLRKRYCLLRAKAAAGAPLPGRDIRKYEISVKIWGDSLPLPLLKGRKRKNDAPRAGPRVRRKLEDLQDMYPHLAQIVESIPGDEHKGHLKRAFQWIDDVKASQLNDMAKKQLVLEIKAGLDRDSVRSEVISMFIKYLG